MVDCSVCLGEHDTEIHSATVSIHRWFKGEIKRITMKYEPGAQRLVNPRGSFGKINLPGNIKEIKGEDL